MAQTQYRNKFGYSSNDPALTARMPDNRSQLGYKAKNGDIMATIGAISKEQHGAMFQLARNGQSSSLMTQSTREQKKSSKVGDQVNKFGQQKIPAVPSQRLSGNFDDAVDSYMDRLGGARMRSVLPNSSHDVSSMQLETIDSPADPVRANWLNQESNVDIKDQSQMKTLHSKISQ